jgi:hypothetical protein
MMAFRAVIRQILSMGAKPWRFLIRSLQCACLLLFCALVQLIAFDAGAGGYELYIRAGIFNELAQLALLFAALVPVCLEDLSGSR